MVSMATASFSINNHGRSGKHVKKPRVDNCFKASVENNGDGTFTLIGYTVAGRRYEISIGPELIADIALHHSAAGLNK